MARFVLGVIPMLRSTVPRCEKCDDLFPNRKEIDGKIRFLHRRKFCLACSPFGEQAITSVPRSETSKRCSSCRLDKNFSDYWKSSRYKDGLSYKCKDCSRRDTKSVIDAKRKAVHGYLSLNPCVDCGEPDSVVLQFDHVRGRKLGNVSAMVSAAKPLKLISEEIAKCDVVCGNCHKRRTTKQFGHLPWLDTAHG